MVSTRNIQKFHIDPKGGAANFRLQKSMLIGRIGVFWKVMFVFVLIELCPVFCLIEAQGALGSGHLWVGGGGNMGGGINISSSNLMETKFQCFPKKKNKFMGSGPCPSRWVVMVDPLLRQLSLYSTDDGSRQGRARNYKKKISFSIGKVTILSWPRYLGNVTHNAGVTHNLGNRGLVIRRI